MCRVVFSTVLTLALAPGVFAQSAQRRNTAAHTQQAQKNSIGTR
jgi:hypothetical protein